jgi:ATP-binding cassette, subfamily B, bacterial
VIEKVTNRIAAVLDVDAASFFWPYLRKRRRTLAFLVLGMAGKSLLLLPFLWIVRQIWDVSIPSGEVRSLIVLGGSMGMLAAIGAGASLLLRQGILRTVTATVEELRADLVKAFLFQSWSSYEQLDLSSRHTRVVQETQRIEQAAASLLWGLLPALMSSVALGLALLLLDPVLVAVTGLFVPAIWLAGYSLRIRVRASTQELHEAFERFSGDNRFILSNLEWIRLVAAERAELTRQAGRLNELGRAEISKGMAAAAYIEVQHFLVGLTSVAIVVFGGIQVMTGRLSLGGLLTFYTAAGILQGYMNSSLGAIPTVIAGNVSMNTLRRILSETTKEPYHGKREVAATGALTLNGVAFSYGSLDILRGVHLTIAAGDNVVITGDNGAGKSTMVKLIAGLYRPHTGFLTWSGVRYDEVDMRALRLALGVVRQHPSFFLGTVRENLLYGREDVADAVLHEALFVSTADEIVARLPSGLETPMGELGQLLSGGERQRLAIARALAGTPRVLVLDEPSTHLALASVDVVMTRIRSWSREAAVLTITHDPTVQSFGSEVFHLENGRLFPVNTQGSTARPGIAPPERSS